MLLKLFLKINLKKNSLMKRKMKPPLNLDVENLENLDIVKLVIMSLIVFMKIYNQLVLKNAKDKINYLESVLIMYVLDKEVR